MHFRILWTELTKYICSYLQQHISDMTKKIAFQLNSFHLGFALYLLVDAEYMYRLKHVMFLSLYVFL
jgi:hypothetical protein